MLACSVLFFTVNGMSLGRAMWQMKLQFGSMWSGFPPNIDKAFDSPLESAIKGIIRKMIQTQPADRISIAEVVERFTELRAKYGADVKQQSPAQ